MKLKEYLIGIKLSLPVFVGYFAVSFGFGAVAVTKGLSWLQATVTSLTNLTSAGQFAALSVIAASAPLADMVITQLVINSRYALMSLALGQKMTGVGFFGRLFSSFFVTDEIFALAMEHNGTVSTALMAGLGTLPVVGWTGGTLMGALAGTLLPESVRIALGVALYGMFVAIVVPQAKKSKPILTAAAIAAALACAFRWLPYLNRISEGMAIVISAVLTALICAVLFPIPEENEEGAA